MVDRGFDFWVGLGYTAQEAQIGGFTRRDLYEGWCAAGSPAYAFSTAAPGWFGDWHPTPRRQFFFLLSGEIEGEVSNDEVGKHGKHT